MRGRIAYWNPQRGFGLLEVRNKQGFMERYFALAGRIVRSEVDVPRIFDVVEFDVSDDKPRKAGGYRLAKNIHILKSQMTAGLETLAAPSKEGAQ